MTFALSVLSASIGVGQFLEKTIAFQWIFAFTIMAVLFTGSVVVGATFIFGTQFNYFRREPVVAEDQERAPLLGEH